MKRVLFLFNHDAAHQVAHLAHAAAATARLYPDMTCTVAYSTPDIRKRLEQLIGQDDARRLRWAELELKGVSRWLGRFADIVAPASRVLRLRQYRALFASHDLIVSTERTCLRLKRLLPPERSPRFAMIPHGAGDRNVSYHPDFARFDLLLVAGQKVVDQLVAHGSQADRIRIVGYPKFDTVDLAARPDFFANGKPTFVYNPHFDPHLSSWYKAGPDLLRWFASDEGQAFNCIFAPHVMLFRKRLHISPEFKVARRRPDIPPEAAAAPNILIDTASQRLFDMSYMLGSDVYIGDVSSQVYEFLSRRRPTFFLDCREKPDPEDHKWHMFWRAGPRVGSASELVAMLPRYAEIGKQYRPAQDTLFDYTFSMADRPASVRTAEAIRQYLGGPD